MNKQQGNKMVKIFSDEINRFGVKPIYLKVECLNCRNSWGITLIHGEVQANALICREGLLNKVID